MSQIENTKHLFRLKLETNGANGKHETFILNENKKHLF